MKLFVSLALGLPLLADVRVKSTLTAGELTTESTVYTKGQRQRLEYGTDATLIQQCDRKRLLQLDPMTRTFQILDTATPATPAAPGKGVVTVKTVLTDTGETKTVFGLRARRIRTVVTRTPSAEACDKNTETVETDGWYVDLPAAALACTLEPAGGAATASCQDQIKAETTGKAKAGYPISYTMTTRNGAAVTSTVTMQVLELETKELAADLFDVPAEWTDAKARKPGVLRIAVAPVNDRTGPGGPAYTQRIFKELGQAKVEAVDLKPAPLADQLQKAKAAEADYLLTAEVAEVKKPEAKPASGGAKRFGGLMSKATGLVNNKDAWEARVDYKLLSMDGTPAMAASATGKTGGASINVRNAIALATQVGTMMVLGPMGANMLRGNLGANIGQIPMGMGAMGANAGQMPMAMGAADPSLSGLRMLSFLQTANAMMPAGESGGDGASDQSKAVTAALGEMLKSVVAVNSKPAR